jgi:hypothetical protein
MPEIGTLRSMSGDGKRGVAAWPKLPRLSSTLPLSLHDRAGLRDGLFSFLQTRCPVASRDARVAGTFPGCGGSEDVASVNLE